MNTYLLKILSIMIVVLTCSCNTSLELEPAKQACEEYLKLLDENKFEQASELISQDFAGTSSKEMAIEKMTTLQEKLGSLKKLKLLESNLKEEFAQRSYYELVYEVHHVRVTTKESFFVVKEAGEYRIYSHNITNK